MSEIQPYSAATIVASERKILFKKYEIGRLLGYGGFAKVYYARDTRNGRSVAVKAVCKAKVMKNGLIYVKQEISAMSRLHHPHVIRIIEVIATKTKVYIIMEFAKGGELFNKVATLARGRFSEDLSRKYFQQLISGVGYCHSRGVYHRDLKPQNLLLDQNYNLKITDFGLSVVRNNPNEMLHTGCGTSHYVAPEVLKNKGYHGDKADVWSCGIILFVLAAGDLPFKGGNLMRLYQKILKGEFKCPRWMSNELKQLLHRLLDTNPVTRITIDEIIKDSWFKKGYKEVQSRYDLMKNEGAVIEGDSPSSRYLNAFDLISLSPGFDLSGMFMETVSGKGCEAFLSIEEEEKVVEMVEAAVHEMDSPRVSVEKVMGETGLMLEEQRGKFGLLVEVHQLTEVLAMVVVRWREMDMGCGQDYWKEKLRPKISNLIYQPVIAEPNPVELDCPMAMSNDDSESPDKAEGG